MIKGEIIDRPFNGRMNDLTGKVFGKLTVKKYLGITKNKRAVWECQCECGKTDVFLSNSLLSGRTISCGCYHKDVISKDISGQHFGDLIALYRLEEKSKYNSSYLWHCQCKCGKCKNVATDDLISGNVQSCGCLSSRRERDIALLLEEQNIPYKSQYSFKDCRGQRPLRFDFGILDSFNNLKVLVEYQGVQHYDKEDNWYKDSIIKHDIMKAQYCKDHNIPLLIINDSNYDDILKLIGGYI